MLVTVLAWVMFFFALMGVGVKMNFAFSMPVRVEMNAIPGRTPQYVCA